MATIMKVMFDDHSRLKRLFGRAKRMPNDLDTAIAICQELDIHTTIEDEIVYPELEKLSANDAREAEAEHAQASEIADQIYEFEQPSPEIRPLVERLERIVLRHIEWEEREVLPLLRTELRDRVNDMGREAFARRQEELEGRPMRRVGNAEVVANSGWGNSGWGGTVGNAGW